ncbi:hypothetical protein [Streptomyces incarnatus]|nr:hypothetical protein [Streptomyces incarnatus]
MDAEAIRATAHEAARRRDAGPARTAGCWAVGPTAGWWAVAPK